MRLKASRGSSVQQECTTSQSRWGIPGIQDSYSLSEDGAVCSWKYLKCLAVRFVCCHVVIWTHTRLMTNFTGLLTFFGLHDLVSFTCLLHLSIDSPWWVCPFVTIFHAVSSDVTSGFPSFPFYFYFLTFDSMCMSSFTSPFLLCFLYCFLFMALANSPFDSSILFLCIYTLYPPLTSCPPCLYIYCVLHV